MTDQLQCKLCRMISASFYDMAIHLRRQHALTNKAYYERFDKHTCEQCHAPMKWDRCRPDSLRHKFCSNECRGHACYGPQHYNWKGGSVSGEGYRKRSIFDYPREHLALLKPMATSTKHRNYVLEHRANLAITLGRALSRNETVHHRNGNKLDNRPENLELRVGAHGVGATASALTCRHCGKNYND